VIRHISGKRVHGTAALPGGMNKALAPEDRETLLAEIETIIADSRMALDVARDLYLQDQEHNPGFATITSSFLSLSGTSGALDLYHGRLRARGAEGERLLEDVDYRTYFDHLREEVRSWSYMKFPYLQHLGTEKGWYRVGPLARINNADVITTPLAEAARVAFMKEGKGRAVQSTLAYHWARMIEVLHAAEGIQALLEDPDILGQDLMAYGDRRNRGIGVIEAPRGTLFHDYTIDDNDLITKANLIVSTTSNNQAMNESIRQVAATYLDGVEPTEGLLNHLEVAIRAYDPCLSCATHALGKMPLEVEVIDLKGTVLGHAQRGL
jgi:NAD-reducing hydrogenase large subunit